MFEKMIDNLARLIVQNPNLEIVLMMLTGIFIATTFFFLYNTMDHYTDDKDSRSKRKGNILKIIFIISFLLTIVSFCTMSRYNEIVDKKTNEDHIEYIQDSIFEEDELEIELIKSGFIYGRIYRVKSKEGIFEIYFTGEKAFDEFIYSIKEIQIRKVIK